MPYLLLGVLLLIFLPFCVFSWNELRGRGRVRTPVVTEKARALAVRTYLLAQGVQSTRIDVRALGNTTDEQPVDRVDAIYAK